MATLSASAAPGPHQTHVLREHGTGIASTSCSCIGLPSPNSVAAYASPSREPRDEEPGPGVLLVCCFLHACWHFASSHTTAEWSNSYSPSNITTHLISTGLHICLALAITFSAFHTRQVFLTCGITLMPGSLTLFCVRRSRRVLFQSILQASSLTMTNRDLLPFLRPHSVS